MQLGNCLCLHDVFLWQTLQNSWLAVCLAELYPCTRHNYRRIGHMVVAQDGTLGKVCSRNACLAVMDHPLESMPNCLLNRMQSMNDDSLSPCSSNCSRSVARNLGNQCQELYDDTHGHGSVIFENHNSDKLS